MWCNIIFPSCIVPMCNIILYPMFTVLYWSVTVCMACQLLNNKTVSFLYNNTNPTLAGCRYEPIAKALLNPHTDDSLPYIYLACVTL